MSSLLLALRVICCLFRDEFTILIRSVSISISGKGTAIEYIFSWNASKHIQNEKGLSHYDITLNE